MDQPFSVALGWPGAVREQCCRCYLVYCPLAAVLENWKAFCELASSSPLFKEKILAAKMQQQDPKTIDKSSLAGPRANHDLQITQASGVQIRILRRGQVLQRKDRRFHGQSYSAKQLKLKRHIKIKEGDFGVSGHIIGLAGSGLEVEVACTMHVSSSSTVLQASSLQEAVSQSALKKAFAAGSFGGNEKGKPFLDLLLDKCPTHGDLALRADRCVKAKQARSKRLGGGASPKKKARTSGAAAQTSSDSSSESGEEDKSSSSNSGGSDSDNDEEAQDDEQEAEKEEGEKKEEAESTLETPRKQKPKQSDGEFLHALQEAQNKSPASAASPFVAGPAHVSTSFKIIVADGVELNCVDKQPLQFRKCRSQDLADIDETSVGGDSVGTRATGGGGEKRRGALPPSYWIDKLCLWSALSGPCDLRIPTQANMCIEREKKKGEVEGPKELHNHMKIYALAKSIAQEEIMLLNDEDVTAALLQMQKVSQAIPYSVCVGLWRRQCNQVLDAFKMQAPEGMVRHFLQMIRPFKVLADKKCFAFWVQEPRLAILLDMWPPKRASREVATLIADSVCTLIGSRSHFDALQLFLKVTQETFDELPEEADPADLIFDVVVQTQRMARGLNILLVADITLKTDFDCYKDLQFLVQPQEAPGLILPRVASAVAGNISLSSKLSQTTRTVKALKEHGPILQNQMSLMTNMPDSDCSEKCCDLLTEAAQAYEKYSVMVPSECLRGFKDMFTTKLVALSSKVTQAPPAATTSTDGADLLSKLKTALVLAQRIFHHSDAFDQILVNVTDLQQSMSNKDKVSQLVQAIDTFENSDYMTENMITLSTSLQALPLFQLSETEIVRLQSSEKTLAASINYTPGDTTHMNAACACLKSITDRLGKEAQGRTQLRTEALQCLRLLLDETQKPPATIGGPAEEPQRDAAADLAVVARTTKQLDGVMKKLKKMMPDEDFAEIQKVTVAAELHSKVLSAIALESIKLSAKDDMAKLKAFAKGCADGDESWTHKCVGVESWPEVLEIAKACLLPLDVAGMSAQIQAMEATHNKYNDIAAKLPEPAPWAEVVEALLAGRTTLACHSLFSAFDNGKDVSHMRKVTKEELGKLKRHGVKAADLPAGLQARIAAAYKGKIL